LAEWMSMPGRARTGLERYARTADTRGIATLDAGGSTPANGARLPGVEAAFAAARDIKLLLFD